MPTMRELIKTGREGPERPAPGLPAQHRRRLVHARHRHVAGRARLDEQHLPPHRRGQLQQLAPASRRPASSRPTTSRRRPSGRARRSSRWSGSARATSCPRCRARSSTSAPSSRAAASLLNYDLPGQPARANAFGVHYQRVDLDDAAGWTNVPASFSPAKQETLTVTNTAFPRGNVDPLYDLYIYDSTNNGATTTTACSSSPSTAGKNGAQRPPTSRPGEWADVKVTLTGARAGQTAGFYVKAIEIAPDLSKFRLYFTSVARVQRDLQRARRGRLGRTSRRSSPATSRPPRRPTSRRSRRGIVDEDTYVEQGLMWKDAHCGVPPLHPRPRRSTSSARSLTCCSSARRRRTSSSTSSWGSSRRRTSTATRTRTTTTSRTTTSPTAGSRSARATSARRTRRPTRRSTLARDLIEQATPTRSSRSDHGFAPQWYAVNVSKVLVDARPPGARAERQLPQRRQRPGHERRRRHAGEGVLRGRHGADLHQPRRTRPGAEHAAGAGRQLRGGPQPDHRGVPEPDRPDQSRASRSCSR